VVEVDLEAEEAKAKEEAEAQAQAIADAAAAQAAEGAAMEGEALAEGANAEEPASTEIVMQEGESLANVKERMKREQAKAKKPTIPPELLNNANSYEDKVGVVRMVVQNDQSRVAGVIRSMIQTQ
jgi:flagellar M-ring protein FliF